MKNLLITLLLFQFNFALSQDPLTPCEQAQANATGLIGQFVPQCEEDGSYSSIQCWGSTGDCWCVDEYGIEIPGTTSSPGQGMPDCASTIDACTLSPDPGNCLAAIQMYYFNQETQQCEDFTWGGCGGVVPFESLAECEAALCAQSGDNCCINPDWINPMAICPWVYDPVIGCDGIEYSNSCFAQAAGVSSWIDQVGSETVLNWDCGGNPVDLCTSPSGVEIFVEGFWQNPADPCEMGECISTGEFVQIIVDCAEEMGLACDGEWVEVEGQCCSECVEDSYCIDQDTIMNSIFSGGMSISSCSEAVNYLVDNYGYTFEDACMSSGAPLFNFDGMILSDYCECTCADLDTCLAVPIENCDYLDIWDPVCGCDNVTYSSVGHAACNSIFEFTIGECGTSNDIFGCTDFLSCNFNSEANIDDGSCIYAEMYYDCYGECINDFDIDGVCDEEDNCIDESNANQLDDDGDGEGDACDYDDGIGIVELNKKLPALIKMVDVLGREQQEHKKGSLLFYIYDNGKVEKKFNP